MSSEKASSSATESTADNNTTTSSATSDSNEEARDGERRCPICKRLERKWNGRPRTCERCHNVTWCRSKCERQGKFPHWRTRECREGRDAIAACDESAGEKSLLGLVKKAVRVRYEDNANWLIFQPCQSKSQARSRLLIPTRRMMRWKEMSPRYLIRCRQLQGNCLF